MNKIFNIKILLFSFLLIVVFLSIGYSAFNTSLVFEDMKAIIRAEANIRITGISVESASTGAIAQGEEYNVSSIKTTFTLSDKTSSITYRLKITNFEAPEMGIYKITGLPDYLDYEFTNYTEKEKICNENNECSLGIVKDDILLTIKYKDQTTTPSIINHNIELNFEFREIYNITYSGITNNGYPSEIIDGDTLTVDFGDSAPSDIKVLVDGTQINEYTYTNGVLTISSVTGNVKIVEDGMINLVQYLTNLYLSTTEETNNSISYLLDENNYLMYDRLGGTTSNLEDGNLRYCGESSNNYIDIGDKDSSGNTILWRIIGVFETKYATDELPCNIDSDSDGHFDNCASDKLVKIIRSDSIGSYSWDYPSNDNNWSNATLNTMLNGAYYNSDTTSYYNNSSNAITVDFTSSGLSSNVHGKIENVLWHLGGASRTSTDPNYYQNLSADGYYKWERETIVYTGNPTEWIGKVGLIYPSDSGYAACKGYNWMSTLQHWTISHISDGSRYVSFVYASSAINHFGTYNVIGVRPVLYLKSDVMLKGGSGVVTDVINDPYVIG